MRKNGEISRQESESSNNKARVGQLSKRFKEKTKSTNKKVKQSCYGPGVAQRLPES
jgi:hypothetical protein